jgi:cytoskeleton protein RodZ
MTDRKMAEAELPLESVGARLARAREAAGLSRAQLCGITKIPERHLVLIEAGDFAALPARTYAVGFSRSYARAVGLDEAAIVNDLRSELAALEPEVRRGLPEFEPGDPARVADARFAWIAALAAVAVIAAGFAFWRGYYLPGGSLPSLIKDDVPQDAAVPARNAAPAVAEAVVPAGGPVVFTALEPGVWVKFYDAAGAQLLQKQLTQGETYTIPAGVEGVQLWTARPQALAITIGGQPVPKLSEVQQTMKDVPVSAAALLARTAPGAVPSSAPPVAARSLPQPRGERTGAPRRSVQRNPSPEPSAEPSAPPPLIKEPVAVTPTATSAADR